MSLNVDIFEELCTIYGTPDLDVFASRINHKLSKYISRFADSGAFAIDAFKHVWKGFIYIFPPFILINRILSKIKRDKPKKVLLIVPLWKAAVWYPKLLKLNPQTRILGNSENLITMPEKNKKSKDFVRNLILMSCIF